jgi:membrane associated rhomboid family serine protease
MNSQIFLPKLTRINKILIILSALFYLFNALFSHYSAFSLTSFFGLSGLGILQLKLHTLLTYPLMGNSFMEVLLNSLMLWLMGSEFEDNWGTARYLKFLLSTVIGGGIFYLAISLLFFQNGPLFRFNLGGLSGIVASLCIAYAVIYPRRVFSFMMIIPIEARFFGPILALISIYQGVSTPYMVGSFGQIGAIISAFIFMVLVSNRNFKILSQKLGQMTQVSLKKKSKAKLTIVKNDNDGPPKYWH